MTIQMQNNRLASQRMDICTCGIAHTTRDLRTYHNLPIKVASVAGVFQPVMKTVTEVVESTANVKLRRGY